MPEDLGIGIDVAAWFEREKGITADTLLAFNVTDYEDEKYGKVVAFDYGNGYVKLRGGIPNGDRRFFAPAGAPPELFNYASIRDGCPPYVYLCEGETDTMRLWQELADSTHQAVVGLPGIETWRDEFARAFDGAETIYVILDNDQDYTVRARVDNSYRKIRSALGYKRVRRIQLPDNIKDVCEFFSHYNAEAFNALLDRADDYSVASLFDPLNLTGDPVEVDWFIPDLIARGDICLLVGEPGIGKSWISMDIATAAANGEGSFLSLPVKPGRVLYVDEENPEDVVRTRLRQLGLTAKGRNNLRYLSHQGARLDTKAELLFNEVANFEPTLVVFDSLTRLHTVDENSSGEISRLFTQNVNPLARELGATILIIHHANKADSGSGYRRTRGSGDIIANVDTAFMVETLSDRLSRPMPEDILLMDQFKSRRSAGKRLTFHLVEEHGHVTLEEFQLRKAFNDAY